VASDTSGRQAAGPDRADTPHSVSEAPGFRKPGFCRTDWDWRPDLDRTAGEHDGEVTPPVDRKGAGAPPLSTGTSTNAQDPGEGVMAKAFRAGFVRREALLFEWR
jgi:hypothetical protein